MLEAIQNAEVRFISHVTAWEIQIKDEKHGLRFGFTRADLEQTMLGAKPTLVHANPFARLLMSQAVRHAVSLATLDREIISSSE